MDLTRYVIIVCRPDSSILTTCSWYNNPDYSDLTIALSDGRDIHVHRNVLCTANEYFKKACGIDSQFVVGAGINPIFYGFH
jgi:hypothetical protein